MKILWFTWKDMKNPLAGGAELVNEEIAKRMVRDGHEVILIVGGFKDCKSEEMIDGYKVIRLGSPVSLYWLAYRYYQKHLSDWPEVVIEEINTIPFFTPWYVRKRHFLLYHQLCRKVWFFQMFFPASLLGYLIEPIYVWLLRKNSVLTISQSTKNELTKYGYNPANIAIFPMGVEIEAVKGLSRGTKFREFTIISLGAIRPMKRALDQVKAFEIAKDEIPELKLKIAGGGSGPYFNKVMNYIQNSRYKADIEYLGRVSLERKTELMRKAHLITVASVKEGWGLIVTEANSQRTPAVVYDVDGLRDSVQNNQTGIVVEKNNPYGLAQGIIKLYEDRKLYDRMQAKAYAWSRELTFENCYKQFMESVK